MRDELIAELYDLRAQRVKLQSEVAKLNQLISDKRATYNGLERAIQDAAFSLDMVRLEKEFNLHCGDDHYLFLTPEEIREEVKPVENYMLCGVYFLFEGSDIVYVGKTTNLGERLNYHVRDKSFDGVAFIYVGQEILTAVESFYIRLLRPPLNKVVPSKISPLNRNWS